MLSMALVLSALVSWTAVAAEEGPDPSCLLQTAASQNLSSGLQQGPSPRGYYQVCTNCYCENPVTANAQIVSGDSCVTYCEAGRSWFNPTTVIQFRQDRDFCTCCADTKYSFFSSTDPKPSAVFAKEGTAAVTGDPHVKTLDGRGYTLLSQGTFLFWRLSGMEAELQSAGGKVKKTPVDWHLYAHYSGHQSFTKGLLLVDMSGGSLQQVLEITAQKCEWRARKANQEWTAVKSSEPSDLISLDAEGNDVTTFNLVTTNGARFHNRLNLNVHTKDGKTSIAVLRLSCRPNHNLNLHITMSRRGDEKHVDGEVKVARAFSSLQTSASGRLVASEDSEFSAAKKWQDLGGSDEAAGYFHSVDEVDGMGYLQVCNEEEKNDFKKTCSKHLRTVDGIGEATFTDYLADCIDDMCRGAGETAAELAAELLATIAT